MLQHEIGKLGLGEHKIDPRTIDFVDVMAAAPDLLPTPPKARSVERLLVPDGFGSMMEAPGDPIPDDGFGNMDVGNCTAATYGEIDATVSAQLGTKPTITKEICFDCYEAIGHGWKRTAPHVNDHGASMLDALNWMRAHGYITDFAKLEIIPKNQKLIELAIDLTMGMPMAVALPRSIVGSSLWDTGPASDPNYKWNSYGPHSTPARAYNHVGPSFRTWKRDKQATWEWLWSYTRGGEGYVVFHRALSSLPGLTPSGYSAAQIASVIRRLRAG